MILTNRTLLINEWKDAAISGSLLTPKHDPNNLSITQASYRSVLSHPVSASLENFIVGEEYSINCYENTQFANGYYEIIPNNSTGFSIVGSGIPSGSLTPTGDLNRLVIVSGSNQGWHVFAENSGTISGSIQSGRLILKQSI